MPIARDTSVVAVCRLCGKEFHPIKHRPGRYCSKACRSRAALHQINSGTDTPPSPMPVRIAHGAHMSVDARPAFNTTTATAMDATAALGDTLNSAIARGANSAGPLPGVVTLNSAQVGDAWRETGEHWARVAAWYAERRAAARQRARGREQEVWSTATEGRVLTIGGYSARIFVKRDALHVQGGHSYSTETPPDEVLYRGSHGVSLIVWLTNGGAGALSLEALKWCRSQRITVCLLMERGEHIATLHPDPDAPQALGYPAQENGRPDVKLRRAQYSLQPSGQDVPLARSIVLRKLAAQRACLDRHPELPDRARAYAAVDMALEWLGIEPPTPATSTLDGVLMYEARAAQGYFAAWADLPLRLDAQAARVWPPSWRKVGGRVSPLTRFASPRNATQPAQALLNFAYAMLESQVRAALYAVGADVVCGILHSDQLARDSLVYDCMEGLRGEVDSLVLDFIAAHTFGTLDFQAQPSGALTIHPSLCRVLAQACRLPQRRADEEARWLRGQILDTAARGTESPSTPTPASTRPKTRRRR